MFVCVRVYSTISDAHRHKLRSWSPQAVLLQQPGNGGNDGPKQLSLNSPLCAEPCARKAMAPTTMEWALAMPHCNMSEMGNYMKWPYLKLYRYDKFDRFWLMIGKNMTKHMKKKTPILNHRHLLKLVRYTDKNQSKTAVLDEVSGRIRPSPHV